MSDSAVVYSTDGGAMCPECGRPKKECLCDKIRRERVPESEGRLVIRYDTKGRKGKGMTLISGLPLSRQGLMDFAKKLKQQLGTGGSVKEGAIELQGDQRDKVKELLKTAE